ncbi:TRAP transporter substrate-binding protein DctP [Ornithinimicrobium murale]|uniref:TRAP transporter substrate-binding protein DctP n=1 Tax=Ornithinimicrobium murale TaxID=1050153 RepID=UPI000E0D6CC1|nr:TRAP transporter substrate-binding protein DctP [Ornithinimicrobium murale]
MSRQHHGKWALATTCAASVLLTACGSGGETSSGNGDSEEASEPVSLQYASGIAAQSSIGQGLQFWVDEAVSDSDGSVEIEMFEGGSLLSIQDTLDGVKDGRADLGYITDGYVADQLPLWTVADIPFVSDDPGAAIRAFDDLYESNEDFRAEFEAQGVHVLHFIPVGPASTGTADPLDEPQDYEGLTIRGVGRVAEAEQLLGAELVFLPLDQVHDALQRNLVDGWSGILFDLTIDLGFHELRNNITDTGVGLYASSATVINLDRWNSLSAVQQTALEEQADAYYEEAMSLLTMNEASACERAQESGVNVTAFSDDEVSEWKDIAQQKVIDGWKADVEAAGTTAETAQAFYDEYVAAVEQYAADSDYVSGMQQCASGS